MNTNSQALPFLAARIEPQTVAQVLGFAPHDIPRLIAAGLLKPLGRPSSNSVKYFAAVEVEQLRTDRKWLDRATDVVQQHWRKKNRTVPPSLGSPRPARRCPSHGVPERRNVVDPTSIAET